MAANIFVFLALLPASVSLGSSADVCTYDRSAMLELGEQQFDQDLEGGWRKLASEGCEIAAADLIRDWRTSHKSSSSTLYWHEGPLRANGGETAKAIALFDRSRKTAEEDAGFGWNLYVEGSIAFLRRDRARFDVARASLAALPQPSDFDPRGPDGKPAKVRWPFNLNVLDGFSSCWNKSYKEAYACATPRSGITSPAVKK